MSCSFLNGSGSLILMSSNSISAMTFPRSLTLHFMYSRGMACAVVSALALLVGEASSIDATEEVLLPGLESFVDSVGVCGCGSCLNEGSGGVITFCCSVSCNASLITTSPSSSTIGAAGSVSLGVVSAFPPPPNDGAPIPLLAVGG